MEGLIVQVVMAPVRDSDGNTLDMNSGCDTVVRLLRFPGSVLARRLLVGFPATKRGVLTTTAVGTVNPKAPLADFFWALLRLAHPVVHSFFAHCWVWAMALTLGASSGSFIIPLMF